MHFTKSALLIKLAFGIASASILPRWKEGRLNVSRVAIFSVDGLHASDIDKYLAKGKSNFSTLLDTAYRYTNAYTTFPSDSFPGTLAQFTGATPKTTGVWYDDTWDRSYYPANSTCDGDAGAEVDDTEDLDYNLNLLFSGGINPLNLPKAKINGKCVSVYPHMRPRVNTLWEVVAATGKKTAYTDKHAAYDLVRGPSGAGLSTGYFPEINWAGNPTDNVSACIQYDTLHVNAFLSWIDGSVPANSEGSLGGVVPTLFGGNFQSVSVGQKTKGYINGSLDFTPDLLSAINFVDRSLGAVVNKLKAKKLYDDTLVVVCSKHGQSPIDPKTLNKIDPANVTKAISADVAFVTADDVALIFLNKTSDTSRAVADLQAKKSALRIDDIIYGQRQIDLGYGDASKDPAVPNVIVMPTPGTIYTTSKSKTAEHGGGSEADRHVACFLSHPKLQKKSIDGKVMSKQVAPTVLKALGIDPRKLQGVVAEGTHVLPGW